MCRCDCGRSHPAANAGDDNPNTIIQMTGFMVRFPRGLSVWPRPSWGLGAFHDEPGPGRPVPRQLLADLRSRRNKLGGVSVNVRTTLAHVRRSKPYLCDFEIG